uniref:Uncharacterized protein n=1 Tax=Arundo donax TaxID=35708 RepID=A0A0A9A863_ARUDO
MKYVVKNQYNGIHSLGYIYICYPSTSLKGVFFFNITVLNRNYKNNIKI